LAVLVIRHDKSPALERVPGFFLSRAARQPGMRAKYFRLGCNFSPGVAGSNLLWTREGSINNFPRE
jgi:hypothetical protein